MQIICKYSGIKFGVQHFSRSNLNKDHAHPIMNASVAHITALVDQWRKMQLSEVETRLLFISLFKNTDLVVWRTYANPERSTIERYMEALVRIVLYKHKLTEPIKLPEYTVQHDTLLLRNIGQWINSFYEAVEDYKEKYKSYNLAQKLANMEEVLYRLLKSQTRNDRQFYGSLARWAFEASAAPYDKRFKWLQIFLVKDNIDIWALSIEDIEELYNHLCGDANYLNAKEILGGAAIQRITKIRKTALGGISGGLWDDEFGDEPITFNIIRTADVQESNFQNAIHDAPEKEPVKKDYDGDIVKYHKDMAAWKLKSIYEEQQKEKKKKLDIEIISDQDTHLELSSGEEETSRTLGLPEQKSEDGN